MRKEDSNSYEYKNIYQVENLDFICNQIDNFDENTLIVFDVDDTLITPCDQFFHVKSLWQKLLLYFYSIKETLDFSLNKLTWYYNNALFLDKHKLIDKKTPDLIKRLQLKNIKVIALTGCLTGNYGVLESVENWRIKMLLNFGIDFSKAFPKNNNFVLDKFFKIKPPIFSQGILFANITPGAPKDRTKAPVLKAFLERVNFKPNKIVFVDDGLKYLIQAQEEMEKVGIPLIGLHYTVADKFLCYLDLNKAKKYIKNLVSDLSNIKNIDNKK